MTDIADAPRRAPAQNEPGAGFDLPRAAFWTATAIGASGAGVAIAGGPAIGPVGAVLLIGVAMTGLVFLMWLTGLGKYVGLYPARGAAEAAAFVVSRSEFALLDALEEPALVAENGATPLAANAAYLSASQAAGALGESARPPAVDRLFGADPLVSAPMYRLANAAKRAQARREVLPAARVGRARGASRYEVSVAPMQGGRTLWRLRDLGASGPEETAAADARRLFMEDAPIGFFAAAPDGRVLYANKALRAACGVADDAGDLAFRDLLKDDPARLLRRDRKGAPQRAAVTVRAPGDADAPATALVAWGADGEDDGARIYVFFDGQAAPSAPAAASAVVGMRPLEGVFENAPFGAAILDSADPAQASIIEVNPALADMSQGRGAPGARFGDLFEAAEGPAELAKRLREASGQPVELVLASQPPHAVHVHFARAGDGRGLAYVVNVSEQREIEQRLAQSEKMREIGTLASGVAHDFNNTLTVVLLSTEYLMRRHPMGDPDFEDLHKINTHAMRARELTEMLLAYARQKTFKREIIDVASMVVQVQELARRLVGDAIDFKVVHARDLPFIKADKTQLERVLMNLVTNARDAMTPKEGLPRGGKLTLQTALIEAEAARAAGHAVGEGVYVAIDVADTGPGIKPDDQAKIFRSFFSTKEPGKGTGLGLTTSFGIIKQLGGYIFFDSVVGKGTTFRIYLPAYEPTAEEIEEMARRDRERVERRSQDLAARGRVLLVEDEDGVRRALSRTLKEFGCEVVEAENGEDALDVLNSEPGAFDLVISDVSMPLMTGPEMLQAAGAEALGKAKVLFLSGYAPESFAKMLEEYPVSFLSKPVSAAELARKVKDILGLT